MTLVRQLIETYTHNHLKTFDDCKRRYYYEYILRLHWPDMLADYELGLSTHKLLDYQAKNLDTEMFMENSRADVKALWNMIKQDEIIHFQVIESEWSFNVRIQDQPIWVEGRIDRLSYDEKNKKYIIIDFKTGQKIPDIKKDDWQSIVYLYGVSEAKTIEPEKLEFLYYKPAQKPQTKQIQYSKDLHIRYQVKIAQKLEEIKNTTTWEMKESCNVQHCQYSKLCY